MCDALPVHKLNYSRSNVDSVIAIVYAKYPPVLTTTTMTTTTKTKQRTEVFRQRTVVLARAFFLSLAKFKGMFTRSTSTVV